MKNLITVLLILSVFYSCKQEAKKETIAPEKEFTTAEKIAIAHGIEQWKNVSKIQFTFNTPRSERSWTWEPKTQNVILISKGDTIAYNRSNIDSTSIGANKAFINDKYWLLAPFQLVWDQGTTISEPVNDIAPLSKIEMHKITLTYPSEGGYTPGDAYDFYFGDDFIIKEWIYRAKNSEEPSLITTWEDYEDFGGIKISKMHKNGKDDWALFFTGITISTE